MMLSFLILIVVFQKKRLLKKTLPDNHYYITDIGKEYRVWTDMNGSTALKWAKEVAEKSDERTEIDEAS